MLDDATVEFVTSTESSPESPDSKPVDYRILNKLTLLVWKHQRKPFLSLELLRKPALNVWPLVSRDIIQSAIYRGKRRVETIVQENWVRIQRQF